MMKINFLFDIENVLTGWGMQSGLAHALNIVFGLGVIFILAWLSDIITKRILITFIERIIKRTSTTWDDIIFEKKVFNKLSHLAPALVFYFSAGHVIGEFKKLSSFVQGALMLYMIIVSLLVVNSIILALHDIYQTLAVSKNRSIKGYVQVGQIFVFSFAFALMLSLPFGKSPKTLLTGIGALAAVLILVFKDTILGFVASIQLSANKMVQIGDWISMPRHNADGTVTEISLNTVKIQNWDKTISTVPTYALISESFGNWRGMEESGGRRIKRHVKIDMRSVRFCSPEMIEKLQKSLYLKEYIKTRLEEIQAYNEQHKLDGSSILNGRKMTNLGVFRKYLEMYLRNHPMIHNEMTFLVRQLQPGETGMPIEIYVFSTDKRWVNYESIQSDIFDHILAVIPEFELRVFQNPTGEDFRHLTDQFN